MSGIRNPLTIMRIRGDSITHTFGKVPGRKKGHHQGWDLEAKPGTPIFAIADGTIAFIDTFDDDAYGLQVCLRFEHQGVSRWAQYAHLETVLVQENQEVRAGQQLGTTGITGNADAKESHLHFEIRLSERPGPGMGGRVSPAEVLGSAVLQSVR